MYLLTHDTGAWSDWLQLRQSVSAAGGPKALVRASQPRSSPERRPALGLWSDKCQRRSSESHGASDCGMGGTE